MGGMAMAPPPAAAAAAAHGGNKRTHYMHMTFYWGKDSEILFVGLAYVLMLALMSFNVGVLLVAVAGHAAGFLLFRAGVCGGRAQVEEGDKEDLLAPAACC